ncbi:MAG: hypothetical protein ACHQ51_02035 [Elusimicrobiota bacterium]
MKTPLLLAALVLSLASSVSANPHGILWAKGKNPSPFKTKAAGGLQYYGGPVISHAKVYAIFWGEGVSAQTKSNIGPFFANILDSTYMDWLSEYNTNRTAVDGRQGTNQTIGRGTFAGAITIQPTNTATALTDEMLQQELDEQIAAGKLPPSDENSLYMLYFPSGVSISIAGQRSCSSFCAYHEGFKSARSGAPVYYGVMPVCGFGCGGGFDGLTAVSSHECLEAVTDPFPTPGDKPAYPQAWNDAGGQEIADLCADVSSTVTGHGLTSTVSGEWDNSIGGCNQGPWTQNAAAAVAMALRLEPKAPAFPLLESLRVSGGGVFAGR